MMLCPVFTGAHLEHVGYAEQGLPRVSVRDHLNTDCIKLDNFQWGQNIFGINVDFFEQRENLFSELSSSCLDSRYFVIYQGNIANIRKQHSV